MPEAAIRLVQDISSNQGTSPAMSLLLASAPPPSTAPGWGPACRKLGCWDAGRPPPCKLGSFALVPPCRLDDDIPPAAAAAARCAFMRRCMEPKAAAAAMLMVLPCMLTRPPACPPAAPCPAAATGIVGAGSEGSACSSVSDGRKQAGTSACSSRARALRGRPPPAGAAPPVCVWSDRPEGVVPSSMLAATASVLWLCRSGLPPDCFGGAPRGEGLSPAAVLLGCVGPTMRVPSERKLCLGGCPL